MKKLSILCIGLFVVLFSACKEEQTASVKIATAANMQYTMRSLLEKFSREQHIKCDLIISSSGQLTSQIKAGAPYDVFVAANMKYPQEIYDKQLSIQKPRIYAYGELVLWTTVNGITPSLNLLKSKNIEHIALANPKTAPYGKAAIDVLKHENLLQELEPKLIYGTSISQTNQFITSQAAAIGFTAKAVVLAPSMENTGKWTSINTHFYEPIKQGIVQINRGANTHPDAVKFYEFMFSPQARRILKKYGFKTDGL